MAVKKQYRLERNRLGQVVLKALNKTVGRAVPRLKRKGFYNPELNPNQGGSYFSEKQKR